MSSKTKGVLCGIIAAICYGTNPLGVLYLYQEGLNAVSTVFYRYLAAVLLLAVALVAKGENFKISRRELSIAALLGVFFGASSLTLYASFNYMDAGLASTILFCYPVMVSVIMAVFYHEKVSLTTIIALVLSSSGIVLLSKGDGNVSMTGVILVVVSSLAYAIYIVAVNRWKVTVSNVKLTFFITLFATPMFVVYSFFGEGNSLQMLPSMTAVLWAVFLGLFPTVLSLVFMNVSIKLAGSTPAAVTGALEPVTAVIIGVCIFGEAFSLKLLFGILLILSAVLLINFMMASEGKKGKKKDDSSDGTS